MATREHRSGDTRFRHGGTRLREEAKREYELICQTWLKRMGLCCCARQHSCLDQSDESASWAMKIGGSIRRNLGHAPDVSYQGRAAKQEGAWCS